MQLSPPPLPRRTAPRRESPPPWPVVVIVTLIVIGVVVGYAMVWRTGVRRELVRQRLMLERIAATMAQPALVRDAGESGLENRFTWAVGLLTTNRRTTRKTLESEVATFGDRFWSDLDDTAYHRALRALAHRHFQTALDESLTAAQETEAPPLQRRASLMLAGQLLMSTFLREQSGQTPEKLFRAALATCDREIEPLAWAEARGYLAEALRLRDQAEEARRLADEALAVREKLVGEKDPSLLRWVLGRALASANSLEKGNLLYKVMSLYTQGGRMTDRELQRLGQECGQAEFDSGGYENAERVLRESIKIGETTGPAGKLDLAKSLSDLGQTYERLRRAGEAEPLLLRGLALAREAAGENSEELVRPLLGLSRLKTTQEDWPAVERYAVPALEIALRSDAPNRGYLVCGAYAVLANLMLHTNRPQEAEILFRRELAMAEEYFGRENPNTGNILNELAGLLRQQSRWTEAERIMRRAFDITNKNLPEDDPRRAVALSDLAMVVARAERPEEAQKLLDRALTLLTSQTKPQFESLATLVQNQGELYLMLGRRGDSLDSYRQALTVIARAQVRRPDPPPELPGIVATYTTALTRTGLGQATAQMMAEQALQESLAKAQAELDGAQAGRSAPKLDAPPVPEH